MHSCSKNGTGEGSRTRLLNEPSVTRPCVFHHPFPQAYHIAVRRNPSARLPRPSRHVVDEEDPWQPTPLHSCTKTSTHSASPCGSSIPRRKSFRSTPGCAKC